MESMSVVSPELRIRAFERRVSVGLWLLDTNHSSCVSPVTMPYCQVRLLLLHDQCVVHIAIEGLWRHTRSCVPSSLGCAETSSLILQCFSPATSQDYTQYSLAIVCVATRLRNGEDM